MTQTPIEQVKELKKSNFKENFIALFSWSFIAQIISFLALPIVTSYYSPDDYGLLSAFSTINSILLSFSTFRIEWLIPNANTLQSAIIRGCLAILNAFAVFILLLFSFKLFHFSVGQISYEVIQKVFTLSILQTFLAVIQGVAVSLCVYSTNLKVVARSRVLQSVLNTGLSISFALLGFDYIGLIIAAILSTVASMLYILYGFVISEKFIQFPKLSWEELIQTYVSLFKETLSAVSVSILNTLSFSITPILIITFLGTKSAGLYFMAVKLVTAPTELISGSISLSFWSEASNVFEHNPKQLKEKFNRMTLRMLGVSILFSLACFVCSFFVPLILGKEWNEVSFIVNALIPTIFGNLAFSPFNHLIVLKKNHYQLFADISRLVLILVSLWACNRLNVTPVYTIFIFALSSLIGHIMLYLMHIKAYQLILKEAL